MKARTRSTAVVFHNDKLLTFYAIDPKDGRTFYFLPGGEIYPDETAPEAAARETLEETGYQIEVDPTSCLDKEYLFHWNGEDYECLTFFYRGHLNPPLQVPQIVHDVDYNKGVVWISKAEIKEKINYCPVILATVLELIQSH